MNAEGWFVDPFARHAARWFSDGTPTALVRDAAGESQDPPPESTWTGTLERVASEGTPDGGDLRRADGADEGPYDPAAARRAALDVYDQSAQAAF
jgi:hypothetical protein